MKTLSAKEAERFFISHCDIGRKKWRLEITRCDNRLNMYIVSGYFCLGYTMADPIVSLVHLVYINRDKELSWLVLFDSHDQEEKRDIWKIEDVWVVKRSLRVSGRITTVFNNPSRCFLKTVSLEELKC